MNLEDCVDILPTSNHEYAKYVAVICNYWDNYLHTNMFLPTRIYFDDEGTIYLVITNKSQVFKYIKENPTGPYVLNAIL